MISLELYYLVALPFISLNAILLILSFRYITNSKILFFVLFIFSIILFAFSLHPNNASWFKGIIWIIFFGRFSSLFFLWIFVHYLFFDNFRIRFYHWILFFLKTFLPFFSHLDSITRTVPVSAEKIFHPIIILIILLNLGLLIHIIYIIVKEWRQDLVNSRLRLRFVFLFGLAFFLIMILIMRLFLSDFIQSQVSFILLSYVTIFLFFLMPFLIQLNSEFLGSLTLDKNTSVKRNNKSYKKSKALLIPLNKLMTEEKIFLDEKLTIGKLSGLMNTESHLLRETINIHLKYNNFNTYLNQYRLKEVIEYLQSPQYNEWSILNIAMKSGFNSLSAFYRTYEKEKEILNFLESPNDYRR